MRRRRAHTLAVTLLLGGGLAAQANETQQAPRPAVRKPGIRNPLPGNPGTGHNRFLDGWMTELLHVDRDAAIKSYKEAMKSPNLPNFQAELATLRLWESSWKPSERARYREAARRRGLLTRDLFSFRGTEFFLRSIGVDKFRKALASGDTDELDRLRDNLAEIVKKHSAWLRNPRSLVSSELNNFRGETDRVDSALEALKRQYKDAKSTGDNRKARQIWVQIQNRLRTKRITASRRINGKRWSEMTRLHLEGQHERASGMESRLPRRGRQRFTAATLIRRIRGWSAKHRIEQSTKLLERLDAQFLRRELVTEERTVLHAMRDRVAKLVDAGQYEKALVLAAQTPYRDRLFGGR